jgi:hypothetical protein
MPAARADAQRGTQFTRVNSATGTTMATPLSLYIPIKQDAATQAAAQEIYQGFAARIKPGLDNAKIVHYARLVLIPNTGAEGILAVQVITTFDGPMNPYLKFFWSEPGFRLVFEGVAALALTPPNPPVTDLTSFENFINSNNLSQPADLYEIYPQTVLQIQAKFPPSA